MARVLIIDDSETVRAFIKEMLTESGHTIIGEAPDGATGIKMFKELRPDITTLDIAMPVMDGMEALEKIMDIDPNAKILMISSMNQNGNVPKSMIHGACEFIVKPFERDELVAIISKLERSIE